MGRFLMVISVAVVALVAAPVASAEIDAVFTDNPYSVHGSPGGIVCAVQESGSSEGQRWCGTGQHNANNGTRSTVESFDGVPVDVNVAFPPAPQTGPDGPYPLVMMFHGYGGGKTNFSGMQEWLERGYAVFAQTNRGFHESCGTSSSKLADPDCPTKGFVRLDDTRYEVRDAQEFAGMLADEGLVIPDRIAATGGSYGGGMSMSLAALRNRTMLPDGSLVDWESPDGTAMELAVALPFIPWTDLAYSLVPNGSNLDYLADSSYTGRFGVMKQGYVNGLYLSGRSAPGYYAPAGEQPSADLAGWKDFMDLGEPYDSKPFAQAMLDEITTYHSSYYIDSSVPPSPLLIASGYTDDLFPGSEATRYYNRTRDLYPNHPIGLFFGSFGHARGQNKAPELDQLDELGKQWIDHYLADIGPAPDSEVISWTQTCPTSGPGSPPSAGPLVAPDWASIAPGEIRFRAAGSKTVEPNGGVKAVSAAFKPTPSGTDACASPAGSPEPGVASYDLPPAPQGGYTMTGSPTVLAKISQAGTNSQLAARLVDLPPDGETKTLVARALWRPAATTGYQVLQLQPNGWTVEEGHRLRLELLPSDSANSPAENFGRPSNGQQRATISGLDLRIPVIEEPGDLDGLVKRPVRKVLPARAGAELAPGYEAIGALSISRYSKGIPTIRGGATTSGRNVKMNLACAADFAACDAKVVLKGAPKKGSLGKNTILARFPGGTAPSGSSKGISASLTPAALRLGSKGAKNIRAAALVGGDRIGLVTVKLP